MTATELIVVGRGRLIASGSVEDLIHRASRGAVVVRTKEADRLEQSAERTGEADRATAPSTLQVSGMDSEAVGLVAAREGIPLIELTPEQATLEEAFMEITRDAVEFHGGGRGIRRLSREGGRPMTTLATGRADLGSGHVTQLGVIRSEWIKLRSLRSTWYSLLATVVIVVGLGSLFSALRAHRFNQDQVALAGPAGGGARGLDPGSDPRSACAAYFWPSWPSACSVSWSSRANTAPG